MTNGERLAFYRKKNALTQQQLGEQLNVSAQAVSKWENDQSEPDIATLCKLAEIYQIGVNDLVGAPAPQKEEQQKENTPAPVIMPVIISENKPTNKPTKKTSPVAKFFKKRWPILILAVLILTALTVGMIAGLKIWDAYGPERMLEDFEQIRIGMTMDEVEDVMGDPDATIKIEKDTSGKYGGYSDSVCWYYRDAKFDEAVEASDKAAEEWDLSFEPDPWTQVRFVFDKEGVLVEAYYNASFKEALWNDYGAGPKKLKNQVFVDETPVIGADGYPSIPEPEMKIYFEDGSIYYKNVKLKGKAHSAAATQTSFGYDCPWGNGGVMLSR